MKLENSNSIEAQKVAKNGRGYTKCMVLIKKNKIFKFQCIYRINSVIKRWDNVENNTYEAVVLQN